MSIECVTGSLILGVVVDAAVKMKTGMVGRGSTGPAGFHPVGEVTDPVAHRGVVSAIRIQAGEAAAVAVDSVAGGTMGGMDGARHRIGEWARLGLWDLGW